MSRIGRAPITIPAGVNVKVEDGNKVTVKGPKGELVRSFSQDMKIKLEDGVLTVERPSDNKDHRSLHGLTRTLINNMVVGVTEGFAKTLEINGVGYRAQLQGKNLNLSLGFSHQTLPRLLLTVSTRKSLALLQQRFAITEDQSHIRARVLSMKANMYAAR